MMRGMRVGIVVAFIVATLGLGGLCGVFLVANDAWVELQIPGWLQGTFGAGPIEIWLPALIAGWIAGGAATLVLGAGAGLYVWRRRQYENLIRKMEEELAELRNLPLTEPPPMSDIEAPREGRQ